MSTYGSMTIQRWLSTPVGQNFVKLLIALLVLQPCLDVGQRVHWDTASLWRMLSWPLDLVRPSMVQAAAPVAYAGAPQIVQKIQLLGSAGVLHSTGSFDRDGDPLTYQWYGPFLPTAGPNPTVVIPEGRAIVSLRDDDGTTTSPTDTTTVDSQPCFPLTARAKADKVQLIWPAQSSNALYTIYRTEAGAPATFVKVARTTSTSPTYLDEPARSERTYLYVVGAVAPGLQCFSAVASAHPTTRRRLSNYAPVIYSTPITHGTTEITYTYDVNATDPNGDVLRYHLARQPAGMTIEPATGLISWTPVHDGTFKVTVVVDDAHGATDTQSFAITVKHLTTSNHPPVAHAGHAQTIVVGATVTLNGSGSTDVDCDPLTYVWSLPHVPVDSGAMLSNPTAVKPTFRVDKPGAYEAQLIVNDGTVDSAPDTVTITTQNSPPVAHAGRSQTVFVGDTVTLDGSGSTDIDGDLLTYHWTLIRVPPGSGAEISDPMAVKTTFGVDKPGAYEAQLVVNDGTVGSAPNMATITTRNSPPVANAGPDQTVLVGTTMTLDGRGSSDVDGDRLTFRWVLSARPADSTAVLSDPAAVLPTFVVDIPGDYVGQLMVNDGTADSTPDTVTITTQNSPPVANAGPDQSVVVGDTVTLDGRKSHDVDGNPLTYRWAFTVRPVTSQATLSGSTAVRPMFVVDEPGTYVVQLIVNDGTVDSSPATASIVTHSTAPVANAGSDQSVVVGDTVTLDGSASHDADHDPLTYQWSLVSVPPNSAVVLMAPTTVAPTFVVDEPGTYVVQLIVNDGTVPSAPDSVVISTQNSRPVAAAGPDQTVAVGDTVTLHGSASHDADHDPLSYRWALLTVPEGSTATLADPMSVTPSFVADVPGTYVAQLIVNDLTVDSVPDTVTVTAKLTVVLVPDVVGLAQAAAQAALVAATLTVGTTSMVRSATVPTGQVLSQQPVAGMSVAPGTAVALVLSLGDVNTAPAIASAPLVSATEGQPYRYDVAATDADGDLLTFALTAAPTGASIGPVTGVLTWTPAATDVGVQLATVQVADGRGGFTTQHFALTVAGVNHPPLITSVPVTVAPAGQPYSYAVAATDPDAGDVLTFALTTAPAGMSINAASGLIQWTPGDAQVGEMPVVVTVSDGQGGTAPQQYQVTVLARDLDLAVVAVDASGVTTETQALVIAGTVRVDIRNASSSPFTGSAEVLVFEDRNHNGTFESGVDNVVGTGTFTGGIASQAVAALDVRVSGVLTFRDDVFYAVVDRTHQLPGGHTANDLGHTLSLYHPSAGVFQPKVKWQQDVTTTSGVLHAPVVAPLIDTNGDGRIDARDVPAVIVLSLDDPGAHTGTLTALRGDTGAAIFTTPLALITVDLDSVAVGDLDGDGKPEVVVTDSSHPRLLCFNNDGTLKWESPSVRFLSTPVIADLDGDGKAEILMGTAVFNADGTLRWDEPNVSGYLGGSGAQTSGRLVADLDLDGHLKIIAGPSVLDIDGTLVWSWKPNGTDMIIGTLDRGATRETRSTLTALSASAFAAVANVDSDPYPEVMVIADNPQVANNGASLWIFARDGRIKAQVVLFLKTGGLPRFAVGAPTVADIDGDGQPEIIVPLADESPCTAPDYGCANIKLHVYHYDGNGTLSMRWEKSLGPGTLEITPWPVAAFDFDGDGTAELVYLDDQKLSILNGRDGTTLFEMGVNHDVVGRFPAAYPIIADVDNDGVAEIVVPTSEFALAGAPRRRGVLVLGDVLGNWRPARRVWNQWQYHMATINEDSSVPRLPQNNEPRFNGLRTQATQDGVLPFGAPDLTVSKVSIDTQSCPASLGITARIGNGGSLHAPPGIPVLFYNGDPAAGGTVFGIRSTTRALSPGDFEDVTMAWNGIAPGQVFVTVNETRPGSPTPSSNLALLPNTWAQGSGIAGTTAEVQRNNNAYLGIDGQSTTRWLEKFNGINSISTTPIFYEVRFPFPVNATAVTVQNHSAVNTGFLSGTLTFSNGFSIPLPLNASGEGTVAFPEQQNVSWVRLTASTPSPGGASLSEFIVAGSYVEPQFHINEGVGRFGNNLAASTPGIPACGTVSNQPPLITSAPPITAREGSAYLYAVQTFDPNADPLTFALPTAPDGMTIDSSTGLLQWTPTSVQTGDQMVTVQVQDPGGLSATQSFIIVVATLPATVTAPGMTGLTQAQAEAAILTAHLTVGSVATTTSSTIPAGTVLSQHPPAGLLVAQGTPVNLVVSVGASGAAVPNLAGLTRTQAEQLLAVTGLTLGSITTAGSATVPIGQVLSQTPALGTLLAPGTAVALMVSVGAHAATTPTLAGRTRTQAEAAIVAAHLTLGSITLAPSATVPAGSIMSQHPPVGTALVPGTSVSLVVSSGPTPEVDTDGDGFTVSQGDCDDTNPNIHPSAFDIPGNGIDEDCNGADAVTGDLTPPVASYTSPAPDAVILEPTDIVGTVHDANFLRYTLSLARVNHTTFVPFATGIRPIVNGVLGQLDPTLLENGTYRVRLAVEDVNGQMSSTDTIVRVQGEAKVGIVRLSFVDLNISVVGIPVTVTRTYDSRVKTQTDFGVGWSLDIKSGSYEHNRIPGEGWTITRAHGGLGFACQIVNETLPHFTEVRLSDRESYTFKLALFNTAATVGGCLAEARFEFVDGWLPGATLEILDNTGIVYQSGANEILDDNTFTTYNPAQVRLTTIDGRTIDLDRTAGITRLQDRNGNSLFFTPGGIIHSTGKSISFTRDAQGRITAITDPVSNTIQYEYDSGNDLVHVTNQIGAVTTFAYSSSIPHYLERIINPDGLEVTKFAYDVAGRRARSCDATDQCTKTDHDLVGRRETVVDPTGRQTVYTYDLQGNMLSLTDGLGNTTNFKYDAANNLIQQVDALGGVTEFIYDTRRNLLSRTEPHTGSQLATDFTTIYTYNATNQLTSITLPTGAQIHITYDAVGNRTAIQDEGGNILASYTYGSGGVVTSESDPFGTTTHVYDIAGNALQSTDIFGSTTSMTYDSAGRLTRMMNAAGVSAAFTYDGIGREIRADYGNGISVDYGYSFGPDWIQANASTIGRLERKRTSNGQLAGWASPDGAEVTFSNDSAGRLAEERDAIGNSTRYHYDAAGRLDSVTDAAGSKINMEYDPANRLMKRTDALGNTISFTYTPDGRMASMTNPNGQTWTYSYTPTTTKISDPLGQETTLIQSPHGLPIEIVYPDGTKFMTHYLLTNPIQDAEDFPTSITDEGGHARSFTYSSFGRLETATDLAGATYTYGYDKARLLSVVGPTREPLLSFTYDDLDRVKTMIYPDGTIQAFTYRANGLPATITLPSGDVMTYQYDAAGRQVSRLSSRSEEVDFSWNANSVLTAVQDSTGITQYSYDVRGDLTKIDYPGGASIRYNRDLLGRVVEVLMQASIGAQEYVTQYAYDAAGNLVSVIDPLGGETILEYDAVNRLVKRTFPNGVITSYTYDNRDQITAIVHRQPHGTVLASVEQERQGVGEPRRIRQEDGSYVLLDYDEALRLVNEAYYDVSGTLLEQISYAYSMVGNRLARSNASGDRTYSYTPGFKLVHTEGLSDVESYGYDANGRVTSVVRSGTAMVLDYDVTDRLTVAEDQTHGTRIEYIYDGIGRRIGARDVSGERRYLVGPAMGDGLESTHLVVSKAQGLVTGYVYAGEHPIMRFSPDGPIYYLTDAMGSVISLTDGTGASVARFHYDGFGNLRASSGPLQSAPEGTGGDFRFHGAWLESATGFYHFRARDYDPRVGRFLSRDPVVLELREPERLHPYAFANSNPYLYRDPTGMFTLIEINLSLSVNNVLEQIQAAVVNAAKDYAKDKAKGVVAPILSSAIQSYLPGLGFGEVALIDLLNAPVAAGILFESLVTDVVCKLVKGTSFYDHLWLQVPVNTSGEPQGDGFGCAEHISLTPKELKKLVRSNSTRPDFIWKSVKPTNKRAKAWLIGDVKLSVKTAYDKYGGGSDTQFLAIVNHAMYQNGHQYSPVAMIVAFKNGSPEQKAKLKEAFLQHGVILILTTVIE